jgi:dienelactone hydrolase
MVAVADPDRREVFTADPTDHRRVAVQVYYPAAKACPPGSYIPSPLADIVKPGFNPGKGFERRLKAHACADAKPAAGSDKYPIVLFSHGLGIPHFYYVSLLEDLASRGNVVVAMDHPHGANATYFAGGSVMQRDGSRWGSGANMERSAREFYRNWAEDARGVLDRIFRNDGTILSKNLAKRVDLARVAYIGHSYGGVAAIYAAQVDSRVKGAVNLDGGVSGSQPADGTLGPGLMLLPVQAEVPIMVLNGMNSIQRQFYAQPVRVARIRGATHVSFSDAPWIRESLQGAGNATSADDKFLKGVEGIQLTRELLSLFLGCAFTQDCARLDSALAAASIPADDKPAK